MTVIGLPAAVSVDRGEGADVLNEELARIGDLGARLDLIVRAAGSRLVFSSSLGIEDQAILHAIAEKKRPIEIVTLDTGRLFQETIETLAESERRYGRIIKAVVPHTAAVEALTARDGVLGFRHSIEARKACCEVRKVEPLRRSLAGASGWITGLRREQSELRSNVPFAAWDNDYRLLKFNPIADWTQDRLEAFIGLNGIPINRLHAQGFPSIGCAPCTRAIEPGEDARAGRWWWERDFGRECGLHTGRRNGASQ
jgi:phosphoadenosine phosphosulfate reductase